MIFYLYILSTIDHFSPTNNGCTVWIPSFMGLLLLCYIETYLSSWNADQTHLFWSSIKIAPHEQKWWWFHNNISRQTFLAATKHLYWCECLFVCPFVRLCLSIPRWQIQLEFAGYEIIHRDSRWIDGVTYCFFNTLRPRWNEQHFAEDIFKSIFFYENVWIPIKISLKFVSKGPINNIPALVQIMAWRHSGDKPLSEPMMVSLPTHICVTRP